MASPQLEDGYTPIANDLFEAFYKCKLLEYERVCVMHIWRKTYGWSKTHDWIANSQFSKETGIPRPHITRTIKNLLSKEVIIKIGKKVTVNKNYNEWKVEWRVTSPGNSVTSPGNKKLPHQVPTKTNKTNITKTIIERGVVDKSQTFKSKGGKVMDMENLIPEVIKLFESVDPKNKTYYGNKTQRSACEFLLKEYGLEEIKKRTEVIPKTNGMQFFPNITTPCQLRDKWVMLDNAIKRKMNDAQVKNNNVIW